MNLSVIIPLYNEAAVITGTLERLNNTILPDFVEQREIIIVDDCSTDNSADIAELFCKGATDTKVIRLNVNSGKGTAVAAGISAATGDTIVIQDADLELDPSDLPALLEKYHNEHLDLVSGSRFIKGKSLPHHAKAATAANMFFSALASKLLKRKISDLTCGYKVFSKELYERLQLKEKGFGFETELMIKALHMAGVSFAECKVQYHPRRKSEGKKIRLPDGIVISDKLFRYALEGKKWLSSVVIAFIIIFMTVNMLCVKQWKDEQRVIEWDAISYYAYLPATFIYHDLSLSYADNYKGPHKFIVWPEKGAAGKYVIKTTMGLSLLWLPFFLAGHVTALLTSADAGGYSDPYKFFLLISSLAFLLTGLIYLRKILLTYFNDTITTLVIAAFAFGTNLYWYTLFQGTMSHVYSFALISAYTWYSMRWHNTSAGRIWPAMRLGLLLGLISLIRPTNIIIVIIFLFYGITSWKSIRQRAGKLAADRNCVMIMLLMTLLVWIPQMIYWKGMTGHWLYFSYGSDERFFFNDPAIIQGLFGWRKGLFIYTPLMIFSFAGIIALWIRKSPFALPVTLFVPLNIYIIFSWWCWWYGGGFGQRAFIDSYALMAIATASLLSFAATGRKKITKAFITIIFLLLTLTGISQNFQYYYGAIHWDSMTKEAFINSIGHIRPTAEFNKLLCAPDYDKARQGADRKKAQP